MLDVAAIDAEPDAYLASIGEVFARFETQDLSFFMIHYDPPDPDAGKVMAIGISMLGFSFATTVLSTMRAPIELYRPSEFVLGGVLRFRWQRSNPNTTPIEIDRKANL